MKAAVNFSHGTQTHVASCKWDGKGLILASEETSLHGTQILKWFFL